MYLVPFVTMVAEAVASSTFKTTFLYFLVAISFSLSEIVETTYSFPRPDSWANRLSILTNQFCRLPSPTIVSVGFFTTLIRPILMLHNQVSEWHGIIRLDSMWDYCLPHLSLFQTLNWPFPLAVTTTTRGKKGNDMETTQ